MERVDMITNEEGGALIVSFVLPWGDPGEVKILPMGFHLLSFREREGAKSHAARQGAGPCMAIIVTGCIRQRPGNMRG